MIEEFANVTPQEARKLIQACFADIRREVDLYPPFVPKSDRPDMEIEEQAILSEAHISKLADELELRAFSKSTERAASIALAIHGLDLESTSPEAQIRLLDGFTRALIEQQRMGLARLIDPLVDYEPVDALFREEVSSVEQSQAGHVGPTINQVVIEYLATKRPVWTQKTFVARTKQLGYMQEFLGPEKRISGVLAADIRGFRNALSMLKSNRGRARKMTFHERLTENVEARVSNKSASIMFEPVKAFFRWAKEEEGILTENPAADVRWQYAASSKASFKRRPFDVLELETLFASPLFTGSKSKHFRFQPGATVIFDAKYWIPIIGFYTGMRLGEIVQLHVSDVVLDSDFPHFDLNENSGSGDPKHIKSAAGVRKVPLHPDLLKLGFAGFVERRQKWNKPCKRLFSEITLGADGQASTQFSKFFARLMDKVGLSDPELTFHSFRHGAEDAFRNANLQQYAIDGIMGHSDGKVSSDYGKGQKLSIKTEAVLAMKLPVSLLSIVKTGSASDASAIEPAGPYETVPSNKPPRGGESKARSGLGCEPKVVR